MKRVLSMSSLLAVGVGTSAALWLSNKPNRIKAESFLRDWKHKIKPTVFHKTELPINKGGHPHPDDLEDNNMVSEGAMYAVQFYNEKMQ
ncbi:hypothetical protein [Neobacillus sp. Marseille-QA0830]